MPGSVFNTTFDCRRLEARILSSCGKQGRRKHSPEVTHHNSSSLLQRNQLLPEQPCPKIYVIVGQSETYFHHSLLFGDTQPPTSTFPRGQGQTTGLYLNWTWGPAKPGTFDSLRLRRREQQPARGVPDFAYIHWVMTHWWQGWDQDKWRDDKAF